MILDTYSLRIAFLRELRSHCSLSEMRQILNQSSSLWTWPQYLNWSYSHLEPSLFHFSVEPTPDLSILIEKFIALANNSIEKDLFDVVQDPKLKLSLFQFLQHTVWIAYAGHMTTFGASVKNWIIENRYRLSFNSIDTKLIWGLIYNRLHLDTG